MTKCDASAYVWRRVLLEVVWCLPAGCEMPHAVDGIHFAPPKKPAGMIFDLSGSTNRQWSCMVSKAVKDCVLLGGFPLKDATIG